MQLGELIEKLKSFAPMYENYRDEMEDVVVKFNFGYLRPSGIDSWRGIYAELAIGHVDDKEETKLKDLIKELEDCIGKTFTGWKGGDFRMDENTEVHIDNPGECSNTDIKKIKQRYGTVYIKTKMDLDD